jgi:hypothetical protein
MNTIQKFPETINAYTYEDYKKQVIAYAESGRTSGIEQLPERIDATKLNAQRMKRIDKQVDLSTEILRIIGHVNKPWTWLILAESWCGDGAQNIPIIAKMAALSSFIDLKIILRDENPEIMNAYLTNGGRSIPKLICLDAETREEIGTWGPRPFGIQEKVKEYKLANPNVPHEIFVQNLHLWYAKDKGQALQEDFEQLLFQWTED